MQWQGPRLPTTNAFRRSPKRFVGTIPIMKAQTLGLELQLRIWKRLPIIYEKPIFNSSVTNGVEHQHLDVLTPNNPLFWDGLLRGISGINCISVGIWTFVRTCSGHWRISRPLGYRITALNPVSAHPHHVSISDEWLVLSLWRWDPSCVTSNCALWCHNWGFRGWFSEYGPVVRIWMMADVKLCTSPSCWILTFSNELKP